MFSPEIVVELHKTITLPEYLVYEMLDGKPIPYRGYQSVLSKEKTLEDIMGSSGLQAIIVSALLRHLYQKLPEKKYEIVTNEAGLHLSKGNNLATDIGIYLTSKLTPDKLTDKYLDIAPMVAIEVDTKADTSHFNDPMNYYFQKTNILLEYGTERIIWITTQSKKIMIATANQPWSIVDWSENILVLPDIHINLKNLLQQRGIK